MDAFFHTLSRQRLFPEAMLRICPGYLPANNAEPVARARRFERRPREQRAECPLQRTEWLNAPEALLRLIRTTPATRSFLHHSPAACGFPLPVTTPSTLSTPVDNRRAR